MGILGTSRDTLNLDYLKDWSEKLGLTELLQKALDEVREEPGV